MKEKVVLFPLLPVWINEFNYLEIASSKLVGFFKCTFNKTASFKRRRGNSLKIIEGVSKSLTAISPVASALCL